MKYYTIPLKCNSAGCGFEYLFTFSDWKELGKNGMGEILNQTCPGCGGLTAIIPKKGITLSSP